jgi:hypothetical protein
MQEQQELHVQQCRRSAEDKWKMARLATLQRRVAQYKSTKMQQCLKCVRAGDADRAFFLKTLQLPCLFVNKARHWHLTDVRIII